MHDAASAVKQTFYKSTPNEQAEQAGDYMKQAGQEGKEGLSQVCFPLQKMVCWFANAS